LNQPNHHGQRPSRKTKRSKKEWIIFIVLTALSSPFWCCVMLRTCDNIEKERAEKEEQARQEKIAKEGSGCGWGGCKDREEKRAQPPSQFAGLAPGTLSNKASLLQLDMSRKEVASRLGTPIGSCLTEDGLTNDVWDNGPENTLVQVSYQSGKVTGWDEGRVQNKELRQLQLDSFLKGSCALEDPN